MRRMSERMDMDLVLQQAVELVFLLSYSGCLLSCFF